MNHWVKTASILSISTILIAASAGSKTVGDRPPLGQRKYIINKNPSEPAVVVTADDPRGEIYLRDPIQAKADYAKPKKRIMRKKPRVQKIKYIPVKLKFGKYKIKGRLAEPRVAFKKRRLPMTRTDEPRAQDFLERVFEPLDQHDF